MKITCIEIQKKDKDRYNIYVDNKFLLGVHEDVIVNMNLYKNKELNSEDIKEINRKENFAKSKNSAIKYISYKMRCEKEIREKLKSLDYNENIIEDTIYYLKKENLLNDDEYVKSFFHDKAIIYHHSMKKIAYDLKSKIIDENIIYKYMNIYEELDRDNILYFINKKIDEYTEKFDDNAYYKMNNFLYKKGFNSSDIKKMINYYKKNKPI